MNKLKKLMDKNNISQAKLHRLSGVAQSHISSIINGKVNPTVSIAQKLATALGVSISELLEDKAKAG